MVPLTQVVDGATAVGTDLRKQNISAWLATHATG